MKFIKTFKLFEESMSMVALKFKNDTFLVNVNFGEYNNTDIDATILVKSGDVLKNINIDYLDDIERIMDISGFSLNDLLQIDSGVTKIEAIDYATYIPNSTFDKFYNTNVKNGSAMSVSYNDVEIMYI